MRKALSYGVAPGLRGRSRYLFLSLPVALWETLRSLYIRWPGLRRDQCRDEFGEGLELVLPLSCS